MTKSQIKARIRAITKELNEAGDDYTAQDIADLSQERHDLYVKLARS